MAEDNIFSFITNHYYQLTGSEKKVADYVFAHRKETQFMSISELADECGVADATISRFCRTLNLKGYNAFKLAIAKAVAEGNGGIVETVVASEPAVQEMSMNEEQQAIERVYQANVTSLVQTKNILSPESVKNAVQLMDQAKKVYCMGQGGSMLLAMEAEQTLSLISPKYYAIQDSHRQISYASLMDKDDVVLFFSYSGSTKEIVELISLVNARGAKVILISRFLKSPGAKLADVVLQCGTDEGPLQLGSVAAKVAQLYIVDVLYQELSARNPEKVAENQEKIANALANKHI